MSCDFGVWFPSEQLNDEEATALYHRLCEDDAAGVVANPAVDAFYEELTELHPEIDDVPEDEYNVDLCPWSVAFERSPGHILTSCVWSKAEYVADLLRRLAEKHGLCLYDPQQGQVVVPDVPGREPPYVEPPATSGWKFSCEKRDSIPLPPEYTFPQAFNYLHSEHNSIYILEHPNGDYIQCGGDRGACTVEIRRYDSSGSHVHYVVGQEAGATDPATIDMSGGIVHVQQREVLNRWHAIELFECFFADSDLPAQYCLRAKDI